MGGGTGDAEGGRGDGGAEGAQGQQAVVGGVGAGEGGADGHGLGRADVLVGEGAVGREAQSVARDQAGELRGGGGDAGRGGGVVDLVGGSEAGDADGLGGDGGGERVSAQGVIACQPTVNAVAQRVIDAGQASADPLGIKRAAGAHTQGLRADQARQRTYADRH